MILLGGPIIYLLIVIIICEINTIWTSYLLTERVHKKLCLFPLRNRTQHTVQTFSFHRCAGIKLQMCSPVVDLISSNLILSLHKSRYTNDCSALVLENCKKLPLIYVTQVIPILLYATLYHPRRNACSA